MAKEKEKEEKEKQEKTEKKPKQEKKQKAGAQPPPLGGGKQKGEQKKKEKKPESSAPTLPSRLKVKYKTEVIPALMKQLGLKNAMQAPKLEKVVINMGVGEGGKDIKVMDKAVEELALISGQKPLLRRAKKSISGFKLRQNDPIGCKVTLRGNRMYEFLDKLFNIAIPRFRDFRGLPTTSFDGRGNYSLGIREQLVFPEIDYDKVDKQRGMDVVIVTTAKTDNEAKELLLAMGMPFTKN